MASSARCRRDYGILFTSKAKRALKKLPNGVLDCVQEAFDAIAANPVRPEGVDVVPLQRSKRRSLKGYRVRIGDYRLEYRVDELRCELTIRDIFSRGRGYR